MLSQLGGRVLLASSSWVETRGADKHGAAPTFTLLSSAKNFQTQNITSADAEKLFYILVTTQYCQAFDFVLLISMKWYLIMFLSVPIN